MSPNSFIGSLGQFTGNYSPINWIACQGQTVDINEYGQLYNLIKDTVVQTVSTFDLPDFRPIDPATGEPRDWLANEPKTMICYQGIYPQADSKSP
jgi:microcystin-dependent protein